MTKDKLDLQGLLGNGALDLIVDSVLSAVDADAIYFFGSYARGEEDWDSDVDILVMADKHDNWTVAHIRRALGWLRKSKDVVAFSQEYFDKSLNSFGNFINGVSEDLVKIYYG